MKVLLIDGLVNDQSVLWAVRTALYGLEADWCRVRDLPSSRPDRLEVRIVISEDRGREAVVRALAEMVGATLLERHPRKGGWVKA